MEEPPENEATQNLVGRCANGDQEAFEALFRRYEPLVRWVIRTKFQGAERRRLDESDLLQTSFLKVCRGIAEDNYREEGQFRAWLVQTVQNKVRDSMRREFADRRDVRKEVAMDSDFSPLAHSGQLSPSGHLGKMDDARQLQEAMEELPEELREVILLRDFELLAWPKVAERLGCAESTARERHKRAYAQLAEVLPSEGEEA